MAWTSPTTRTTGNLITAAIWNTDLVDNLTWLHDGHYSVIYKTGDVVHNSTGNWIQVTGFSLLAQTETFWSAGAPDGFTIPANMSGLYEFRFFVAFDANGTGARGCRANFNGGAEETGADLRPASASTYTISHFASLPRSMVPSDFMIFYAFQNCGGNLTMKRVNYYSIAAA